jgi:hypothetical protein
MTTHTPRPLARKGHRLDRLNHNVEQVLAAMRTGAVLHRTNRRTTTHWVLSNGKPVTDTVARIVITHANVVGADDGLFSFEGGCQTWRFIKTR